MFPPKKLKEIFQTFVLKKYLQFKVEICVNFLEKKTYPIEFSTSKWIFVEAVGNIPEKERQVDF